MSSFLLHSYSDSCDLGRYCDQEIGVVTVTVTMAGCENDYDQISCDDLGRDCL